MNLVESYQTIKPSIVAFAPKFHPVYNPDQSPPEFPPIFGTGFVIADGIVVTNDHVVKAISKLPKPKDCPPEVWPVNCLLLHHIPDKGVATVTLEIIGIFGIEKMDHGKVYYGPPKPDVAFVHVKMKGLPCVNVKYNLNQIKEGREVATSGFPMGTETLMAPGYLHQLTPTLQKDIISAVLPFPCESPHALMINVMVQGGASGSPVFLPDTGEVIGILYAGLEDFNETSLRLPREIKNQIKKLEPSLHSHIHKLPTNISYVVPAHYIEKMLGTIVNSENYKFPDDTQILSEFINKSEIVEHIPGEPLPSHKIWEGAELIDRKIKKIKPNN